MSIFTSLNRIPARALIGVCLLFATVSQAHARLDAQMVDLGSHQLHMVKGGEGEVTVIFEAGFGSKLTHWRKVAPQISQHAQIVAYSRAGYGESTHAPETNDLAASIADLRGLVIAAELKPPFVLVGHSYGGHIIRGYAEKFPQEVVGMVFVDPANEGLVKALKAVDKEQTEAFLLVLDKMVPDKFKQEHRLISQIDEAGELPSFGTLPDVPAVILTAMKKEFPQFIIHSDEGKAIWRRLHGELFARFASASHVVTQQSGHNIALEQPELVVTAVQNVLTQANAKIKQQRLALHMDQAQAKLQQGQIADAEQVIADAIQQAGLSVAEVNTLGYKYMRDDNQLPLSAAILKVNVRRAPDDANVYDSYGEALLKQGLFQQAKEQFEKAIALAVARQGQRGLEGYQRHLAEAEAGLSL